MFFEKETEFDEKILLLQTMESCRSGRSGQTRNLLYPSGYRGFESLALRKNPTPMSYVAYILKSLKDGTCYYGSTQNIENRLREHQAGKCRYTKGRRPWKLIYSEEYPTRSEAFLREHFFKSIEGYKFLKEQHIL